MDQKHTPTPWATRGWTITGPTAAAEMTAVDAVTKFDNSVHCATIAQSPIAGKSAVATAYGMTKDEAQANAALIERAVNSHEQLVAALGEAIVDLECSGYDHSHPFLTKLRAALTAAGAA